MELTLVELVVFVLAWVFSLVMLIIIRRYNLSAILKNFFNLKFSLYFSYLLKFFVFVAVVAVIPLLVTDDYHKSVEGEQYKIGVCQYSCRIFIFQLFKRKTSLQSVGLVIE